MLVRFQKNASLTKVLESERNLHDKGLGYNKDEVIWLLNNLQFRVLFCSAFILYQCFFNGLCGAVVSVLERTTESCEFEPRSCHL